MQRRSGLARDVSRGADKLGLPGGAPEAAARGLSRRLFAAAWPADQDPAQGPAQARGLSRWSNRRQPSVLRLGGDLQPDAARNFERVEARKVATLEARARCDRGGQHRLHDADRLGTRLPVVHTVELLDWANGGPKPPALLVP
jgi:hypothetical protein